ncbi:LysR family transcriptional regulator [Pseudoalteromonas lipolytica SCSIO 04301]|uniref:LysR family transcriptional regulator n=1 Tax=Pseudoalteromonas TaxID=53246 RepID=UPI00044E0321|nr:MULTISPECIES: LysR family transcriptional regulator [Pseudoalteromonas]EWH05358.1 LysR family transcriptional regulator [Pseudoalteromonas lipolytica SCSIO 04301]QMW16244.1 LysR family transcriptional regulator [Pseudoalteromonas sp. MT33b]
MNSKLIKTLRVFSRTVETGNMSSAAAELSMTTSAVSQHIKQLEQEIGLSLFNRSPRELTLTEAGHLYYQSCLKMLALADQASTQLQHLQSKPSGELKLVAPVGFGGGLLSEPLERLINEFDDLRIQLILTDEPIDMIKSGADLAIAIGPLTNSNLIARKLATWPLKLCAHRDHPIAKFKKVSWDDLHQFSRISHTYADSNAFNPLTLESKPLPKAKINVNNMQSLIALVCDGVGYGVLPEPEVRHLLRTKELIEIAPEWAMPNYTVYAVTPARDSLAAKTKTAIETIKHCFNDVSKQVEFVD